MNTVFVIVILIFAYLIDYSGVLQNNYRAETIFWTGTMLLSAFLIAEAIKKTKLPKLTGYMITGILIGPAVLNFLTVNVMDRLHFLESMALSLIALIAGGEFKYFKFVQYKKMVLLLLVFQVIIVFAGTLAAFEFIVLFIPAFKDISTQIITGFAILIATTAVSKSPATTMGIISEIRASGKNTEIVLMTTVIKAVTLVVIFPALLGYSKTYLIPGTEFNLDLVFQVGKQITGSIAIGISTGIIIILYLKYIGKEVSIFLLGITLTIVEMSGLLGIEVLLTSIIAGIVVQNFSKTGKSLIDGLESFSLPLYVIFFCFAGASLKLELIPLMFPVTFSLILVRIILLFLSNNIVGNLMNEDRTNKYYSWMGYVGQAGIAVGLAIIIEKTFEPEVGELFLAILIPIVVINELLGPILLKYFLNKVNEADMGKKFV